LHVPKNSHQIQQFGNKSKAHAHHYFQQKCNRPNTGIYFINTLAQAELISFGRATLSPKTSRSTLYFATVQSQHHYIRKLTAAYFHAKQAFLLFLTNV
jgi:hypothetical protein